MSVIHAKKIIVIIVVVIPDLAQAPHGTVKADASTLQIHRANEAAIHIHAGLKGITSNLMGDFEPNLCHQAK